MTERKAIPKKLRFEVFKRDGFCCQYCGAHPPTVILHVDHIHPVALDGRNDIDNLITACEPCNAGKGARELGVAPETVASKSTRMREAEEQLLAYQKIARERADRLEEETWEVAETLWPGSGENGANRHDLASIKNFVSRLGVVKVLELAELSYGRKPMGGRAMWLYFCGCCWRSISDTKGKER